MRTHSSWLEIDLDAAASNLRVARRLVGENCKIFAVLKGNAYGFGMLEMARVFVESGADALALADLSHAIVLREHGFTVPILLYPSAVPDAETAAEVIRHDITPTLITIDTAALYSRVATQPLSVFCKVDVGLQRLGIPIDQAAKEIRKIAELRNLKLGGICTHLHVRGPDKHGLFEMAAWSFHEFGRRTDARRLACADPDGSQFASRAGVSGKLLQRR